MGNELSTLEKNIAGNAQAAQAGQMLGPGAVATSKFGGGQGSAVILETAYAADTINPIVQFSINNAGVGATDQLVRFGSVIAAADAYLFWDLPAGASDDAVIVDQNGAGCQFVQGFSKLVSSKSVIVSKIKVKMATTDIQLNNPFTYNELEYDGTVKPTKSNVGYTESKYDQQTNIVEVNTNYILDAQNYLEYQVLATKSLSVFFQLEAANSVETFKALPKYN